MRRLPNNVVEQLGILVDSNEALPQHRGYRFPGDEVTPLDVADYTGRHVLDRLRIERKSLPDFLGCVGGRRETFERSLGRMAPYPQRYLLLEFTLAQLVAGRWRRTKVLPQQAIGSLFGWSLSYGVQPIFAGDAEHGRATVLKLVELSTRHALREAAQAAAQGD